jgi:hypothetical protein
MTTTTMRMANLRTVLALDDLDGPNWRFDWENIGILLMFDGGYP